MKRLFIITFILLAVFSKTPIYGVKGQVDIMQSFILRGKRMDSITKQLNGAWLSNMFPTSAVVNERFNSISTGITDTAASLRTWAIASFLTQTQGDARYIQVEVDPVFSVSAAFTVTSPEITNWNTAYSWGNHAGLYPLLLGSYGNPSWITSLAYSKLTGAPTLVSAFTNDAGYLTAITLLQVTTALGFTPYNSTNPAGYISAVPAQSFSSLTGKPTTLSGYGITDGVNSTTTININGTTQSLEANRTYSLTTSVIPEVTNLYFTTTRAQNSVTLTTTGSGAATYSGGILNIPTPIIPNPSVHDSVSRTLNSNYTISATKPASVCYSISIAITLSLLVTSGSGTVFIEYSINSGTSWKTLPIVQFNPSVTLTGLLSLSLVQTQVVQLGGWIPANALVRLRTSSSGTTTITYLSGQEYY